MKIALIGYGRVGKTIDRLAEERGLEVVARIDHEAPDPKHRLVSEENISEADVCIDFSHYETQLENIETVMKAHKAMVIGTTGCWYNQLENAKLYCEQHQGKIIYGPNFSLGMNLFAEVLEVACKMIGMFNDYDVGGVEIHHTGKADSPSGTAQQLASIIVKNFKGKNRAVYDRIHGQISKEDVQFASVRCGHTPGIHTIFFSSPYDTMTFTHEAQSREGWARGALYAAAWLLEQKQGFYHTKDLVANLQPETLQ